MITHIPKPPPRSRGNYVRLIKYLLDPKNTLERVGRVTVTNCHSQEPMLAALEVKALQRLNTRSKADKTYHFIFSFREGERPSAEVLLDCERELCEALGFAEHQRVSVVHGDTNNLHVHVAINRVHPTKRTVHTPYRDYWVRSEAAKRLEIQHNLQRDRHDRRDPAEGPTGAAADMERHSGIESLLGWIQRNAGSALCAANSWDELHRAAQAHGLRVQQRGNGCVIAHGERMVRASAVRRELSLAALEKKLGPFRLPSKPARVTSPSAPPAPPHLRGRAETLAAAIDRHAVDQVVAAPRALTDSQVPESDRQEWARVLTERVRSARALLQDLEARDQSHHAMPTGARLQGAVRRSGMRAEGPPPHLRGRLRGLGEASHPPRAELLEPSLALSLEEQQRRMDAWAQLIDDLSRADRAKRGRAPIARRAGRSDSQARYRAIPVGGRRVAASELFERFVRASAAANSLRRERGAQLRTRHQDELARLKRKWALRRAALRLVRGTRDEKRFMYAAARQLMLQELKAWRARATDERRELITVTKRQTWVDWLQERARAGDTAALGALRSRRVGGESEASGDKASAITGRARRGSDQGLGGAVDTITKTGVVIYRGALGGVRDDGQRLRVDGNVAPAVLTHALRLAATRYGSALRVEGDAAFKRAVVDAAVVHDMHVTFDDPELEARRAQQRQERDDERRSERRRPQPQERTSHAKAAPKRPQARPTDGLRDVRARELVRDREGAELLLPRDVPAHVARGAEQDREALRRAARAARKLRSGPPPERRGRLRPLSTLRSWAGDHQVSGRPGARQERAQAAPPRPPAPRTSIATLGSLTPPAVASRDGSRGAAAVAQYVAERNAKRAHGLADVLVHAPFDGRAREFVFVGARRVAGHALHLLRDGQTIVVLDAQQQSMRLRSGDRVTLSAEGQIIGHHRRGRR